MIESKKIHIIVAIAMAFALMISVTLTVIGNTQKANGTLTTQVEYATKIFGTDIISIEIIANEDDWEAMLADATSKTYIMADVIVNGKRFQKVGIRPKGNSSLSQVASSDSDRYSFQLKFDKYIKGQTCFGLESFVVNNMIGDNTYLKEYISYDLMHEIGVAAPYFGFADIKVNDESWGLYLAVELYNESYELRVSGDTSGMLYSVKIDMGGNRLGQQGANIPIMPDGQYNIPQGMTMGGFGGSGGSLEYTDDNTESYGAIFNNVVGKGEEEDFQRVVEALKALSEGRELEVYFDVDQILRYLAAHTIVVNLDSYSSSMAQNYYIYEREGKISILPWDYNLAWGGFQSSSTSSVINFPIDTPISGVQMSNRPLIEQLFANEDYLERYHSYLQQLINDYFINGQFEEKINTLDTLISDYVENDATAFCTYEAYKTAISTFTILGNLRAQSVQGQLDGTVPSTTAEQIANPERLISASHLNLDSLGDMMAGGNRVGMGNRDGMVIPDGMVNPYGMVNPGGMVNRDGMVNPDGMVDRGAMGNPGDMGNPPGNWNMPLDEENFDSNSPVNVPELGLKVSGLYALVLISTFFVVRMKRNY